jgi:type III secretion protein N (ATPase)
VGQRVGIFSPAGCGKSTLLGRVARNAASDVSVIALVGERGREVNEFIADSLGPQGLARSVLVVATADRPALERAQAVLVATTIAEHFREQGARCCCWSTPSPATPVRCARSGWPAASRPRDAATPPSVISALPQLFERAGRGPSGSITAMYTVLEETDDGTDPIAEEVRSLLDGHLVLSRELAEQARFPAIDVLASVSRVMPRVTAPAHLAQAMAGRALLARHRDLEMLIRMGEYQPGHDAQADAAVRAQPGLQELLKQAPNEHSAFETTLARLAQALR